MSAETEHTEALVEVALPPGQWATAGRVNREEVAGRLTPGAPLRCRVPTSLAPHLNLAVLWSDLQPLGPAPPVGSLCYERRLKVLRSEGARGPLDLAWRPASELFDELPSTPGAADEPHRSVQARSFSLAERAHRRQRRHDGMPYLLHPLEVALQVVRLLAPEPPPAELISAALLHDVVEDGHLTLAELRARLGERIAELVELLTVPQLTAEGRVVRERRYFGRMLDDDEAVLLKCADMLCNAGTLHLLTEDSLRRRLTAKYAPQIQSWLLPRVRAAGQQSAAQALQAWLVRPLTLLDLHHTFPHNVS